MIYGYTRVSTKEQHPDRGVHEIEEYCKKNSLKLEKVYVDQATGRNFNRERYIVLTEDVLRSGDILIITEIDRLGRNKNDIADQLQQLKMKGVRLMVLELPTTLVDLGSMENDMAKLMLETINNILIELYSSIAQAELEKRQKRQREGMEQMKARGEWEKYGRPRRMDFETFCREYGRVERGERKPSELMRELELTAGTYYRYKKQYESQKGE